MLLVSSEPSYVPQQSQRGGKKGDSPALASLDLLPLTRSPQSGVIDRLGRSESFQTSVLDHHLLRTAPTAIPSPPQPLAPADPLALSSHPDSPPPTFEGLPATPPPNHTTTMAYTPPRRTLTGEFAISRSEKYWDCFDDDGSAFSVCSTCLEYSALIGSPHAHCSHPSRSTPHSSSPLSRPLLSPSAIYCFCDVSPRYRAIKLTTASNKNGNLGRMFYRCRKKKDRACRFFIWEECVLSFLLPAKKTCLLTKD